MNVVFVPLVAFASLAVGSAPVEVSAPANPSCILQRPDYTDRASPLDSVSFQVSGHTVLICYGRPAARGRTMIGGRAVPFGRLWRTGANEPTMIHTTGAVQIAGVEVGPGTYSFYTVPGEKEWGIIVNRSTSQWGHEGQYSAAVEAQEVGRGSAPVEITDTHVEQFTIRAESSGAKATVFLEWENTRVRVPVEAAG